MPFRINFNDLQVGASKGLDAVRPYAPKWAAVFQMMPAHILMPFLHALLAPPCGGRDVAEVFAEQIVQSVARLWLGKEASKEAADELLLLLAELCGLLRPLVRSNL